MSHVPLDADTVAPPVARHGVPEGTAHFRANTRWGDLRIALHDRGVMPHRLDDNVRAALLLDRIEPLLRWLEDGLQSPIEPDRLPPGPGSGVAGGVAGGAGVGLRWQGPAVDASLGLPWPMLQALAPPQDDRDRWQRELQWQAVATELELSRQTLGDDEWQALQHDGAGLLLPESFSTTAWPCRLRSGEGGLECAAQWHVAQQQVSIDRTAGPRDTERPGSGDARWTRVSLAQPLMLAPPAMFGWAEPATSACSPDSALRVARDGSPVVLHGHLVPIGLRAAPALAADLPSAALLHGGYVLRVSRA